MLARIAAALTAWSTRWVPDAFVIAILLTLLVALLALVLTPATPLDVIDHWGAGFWALLSFAMQMCLVMLGGYVVAVSGPVRRALSWLARRPRSSREAVAFTALLSMSLALLNWGMGLIAAAVFTQALARERPRLNYPLVVACAYLGLAATWHAGLSASAPLMVATPGNFLEKDLGGTIPTSETIFHPFNIALVAITVVALTALAALLDAPEHEMDVRRFLPAEAKPMGATDEASRAGESAGAPSARAPLTPAERLENSRWPLLAFGAAALGRLALLAARGTFSLDLDTVNFALLATGALLHGTPAQFLAAAREGAAQIWGIVVQFPLYAGIYGIIKFSNLQDVIAGAFTSVAGPRTFPLVCYWYSGVLNYFVPSGGSKWAIEAPYMIRAAGDLGVPQNLTVLAYAWGDMMTDAIQPFWAIPLLGIARLGFRDIMGYLILFFVAAATIASVGFWLAPRAGWF